MTVRPLMSVPRSPYVLHPAPFSWPVSAQVVSSKDAEYTLQQMKFGPKSNYLCLIPPPPQEVPVVEEAPTEIATPVHSWSLLQPLSGTCLYVSVSLPHELNSVPKLRLQHRQGWFTYSYCHNSHVRQFHELHHQHVPTTGDVPFALRPIAELVR